MVVPSFRIALAMAMASIPIRVGPATHLYCLALLNRPIRQHRSAVEKHEAEYNLDLLSGLKISPPADIRPWVKPAQDDVSWAREKLRQLAVPGNGRKMIVINPCSSGSARTWKEHQWAALIKHVQDDKRLCCVLTGAPKDRAHIDHIILHNELRVISLAGQTTLGQLIALLSLADAFVSPSTGPLHLASALGIRAMGIFPPIRVQSPKRWGPWRAERAKALQPRVTCPAKYHCQGEECDHFDCMDQIKPGSIYREISKWLF